MLTVQATIVWVMAGGWEDLESTEEGLLWPNRRLYHIVGISV